VLATLEAGKLGIGSDQDIEGWKGSGLKPPTPILWFFGFVLMWLLSYPTYLSYRSRYGVRNLFAAGIVSISMVVWFIPLWIIGSHTPHVRKTQFGIILVVGCKPERVWEGRAWN
jgi:hypothetical protein